MGTDIGLPIADADVRRINALVDPVLRNLWITTAYHDFASRLAPHLGGDITWCGFAVWASRTAGASIRGDELPNALKELLASSPEYRSSIASATRRTGWLERAGVAQCVGHEHVMNVLGDATVRISQSIADGNRLVFEELAPLFVVLCERLEADPGIEPTKLVAAIAEVLDAREDHGGPDRAGIELAFACYAEAVAATDADHRAELVLAGNIAAVAHEQERLQPNVKAALDAALDVALPDMVSDLTPRRLRGLVTRATRGPLHTLADVLNGAWDTVATAELMRFQTADETLRLDQDLPILPPGDQIYPEALVDLDEARAIQLWEQWRPAASASASDWERLQVRMNFIVHLFRSRQQHAPLLQPPYTPAQLDAMRRGEVPEPPL